MKAIVLAGGYATRLRPLSFTRPKPLFPILDKPLMDWILENLKQADITDIVFSTFYIADAIQRRYGFGLDYGIKIKYTNEKKPMGDAGPLRLIDKQHGLDGTFMVVNGDIFSNIDFSRILDFHHKKGGVATVALSKVKDASKYGVVLTDDDSRLYRFFEKPKPMDTISDMVNAGVYVFEKEVLDLIVEGRKMKIAVDVIPKLVEKGDIYGYIHDGYWRDIGFISDFTSSNHEALNYYYPKSYISSDAVVGEGVELIDPVYVSHGVKIEDKCCIGPYTVLGADTFIEHNVRISQSIVFQNCLLENASVVKGSVLGEGTIVGRWAKVEENSIIGDQVVIANEVTIAPEVTIFPFKEITSNVSEPRKIVI